MVYCYPRLSDHDFYLFRLIGPGLGNLLFPWARALVYAEDTGAKLLAPTWPQMKIGTLIRREFDSRTYSNLFSPDKNMIGGLKRIYKLSFGKRISETQAHLARTDEIVEFRGMGELFAPLSGRHGLIRERLMNITRPEHLAGANYNFGRSITLHVRLGDFQAVSESQIRSGRTNSRIPASWYTGIIEKIRKELNETIPVYLFSDGTDAELEEIYKIGGVKRLNFGSAIADIWALSSSNVFVASGSTFSMWGSYLGQMPALWYPGQYKGAKTHGSQSCYEVENINDLPDLFWDRLVR